jgi:putative colanic acid biosynthesis acetyltransferase WcaF
MTISERTAAAQRRQKSAYDSPWTIAERARMLAWDFCWPLLCAWTPKPLNRWRLFWLKRFGCRIDGLPFVHQRAVIQKPWNLILHDRACLGDRAVAYSLGVIELMPRSTVAQEAYLCTGTHDFSDAGLPLLTAGIVVDEDAFVGARAFVMPGVTVGRGAVVGACSVVTRDVEKWTVSAGNPCRQIGSRFLAGADRIPGPDERPRAQRQST